MASIHSWGVGANIKVNFSFLRLNLFQFLDLLTSSSLKNNAGAAMNKGGQSRTLLDV